MKTEQISVNTQSSIRIAGSKTLYFDPFKRDEAAHDADYVFLTHEHYDHLDPDSLKNVITDQTILVVPETMAGKVRKHVTGNEIVGLRVGEHHVLNGVTVDTVPAYNKVKPFHPRRNGWLGYIVTMDGIRYYVAGDTDAVKELRDIDCDIAMVPIGGTYTMTAKEAAALINDIRPQVAIPIHYGSIVGKMSDAEDFRGLVEEGIAVVTKL